MSFIDSVTSQLISKALDISVLKHDVIANNIANVNSENYKAFKIDFDAQMEQLKNIAHSDITKEEKISMLKDLDFTSDKIASETDIKVVLDDELVALNKNVTNYQALLSAKKNYGSIMTMAIRGGK